MKTIKVADFHASSTVRALYAQLGTLERACEGVEGAHPAYGAALRKAVKKARKALDKAGATPELLAPVELKAGMRCRIKPEVIARAEAGEEVTSRGLGKRDGCTFILGTWARFELRVLPHGRKRDDDAVHVTRVDGRSCWEGYKDVYVSRQWLDVIND